MTAPGINVDLLLLNLKKKLNLSDSEIRDLSETKEIKIPISIFTQKIGMLESITLYLHDELGLSYGLIGKLLGRNYKTIWTTYDKAKKKSVKH
ncbi:MAG: hypothetical protein ABIC04_04695 [Nanoarchaeota archaeon]